MVLGRVLGRFLGRGVGPSALEPFVLAFFPQYKSSEAEGNFKIWYILY